MRSARLRGTLTSGRIAHQRPSPFTIDSVPSTALIDKVLRKVEDAPGTVLGEHTVDVLCSRLQETAQLLSEFALVCLIVNTLALQQRAARLLPNDGRPDAGGQSRER